MTYTGWGSHRWSGWPGSVCELCRYQDPLETMNTVGCFPFPEDLDNPTQEEIDAQEAFYDSIDEMIGNCRGNPDGVDPYTIPVPKETASD